LGHVSDRYGYSTALILSSLIAGLSAFFLWGFAGKSFALLMTFVIVYGTAGSGFTSSFPSIVTDIAGTEYRKPILINGVFMLLRGIGNVVGNPLGSLLLTSANRVSTGWNHMIYFVGSALIASAVCGAVRYFMRTQTV
jgi:MCP family monocarboxylic acid transporter-like MFS transporter 10